MKNNKMIKDSFLPVSPIAVAWNFTYSCNMNCEHCYSRTEKGKELSPEKKEYVLKKLIEAKVLQINFGGGESLLRPELFPLIRLAKKNNIDVAVSSNGWLINKKMAEKLLKVGVDCVNISIDSSNPNKHDKFRNTPGSFKRAVSAIKTLKKLGIKVKIFTVLSRLNFKEIEKIIKLAENLRVDEIVLKNYKPAGKGLINIQYDLKPLEWKNLYLKLMKIKKRARVKINLGAEPILCLLKKIPSETETENNFSIRGDPCGKLSLCLKPNGDITPCAYISNVVLGNMLEDDLLRVWNYSPFLLKLRNKKPKGKCKLCPYFKVCMGGCFSIAYNLTGDINAPDPHCWWGGK